MRFSVVTLFPDLINEVLKVGVVGQAVANKQIAVEVFTPRSWTHDIHKTVDDRPFGGGDGMVLMSEPLAKCLDHILAEEKDSEAAYKSRRLFLSPQGRRLDHSLVMELSLEEHLILLCGRYAGVDQRLLNTYDFEEVSIGDYVLSGGELAALVLIDSIGRQKEGVLGHSESSRLDSFAGDGLLEAPCYTRPREWRDQEVPEFLLTGNHAQIAEDRWIVGVVITFMKRPDLLSDYMKKQTVKRKVWQKCWLKLNTLSHQSLTSLGITRKTLEDFENYLKSFKLI